MKRYEYRIEFLKLTRGKSTAEQILDALNAVGGDGWRLNQLLHVHLSAMAWWKGGIDLLLEREVEES